MKYIKQLDSLRAIAAILVVLWHWLPNNHHVNALNNGSIGVNIFFVLSGFLISAILFKNRNKAEKTQEKKLTVFKNFYIRRALRIFPIYYLTVFFIYFFHARLGASFTKAEFFNSLFYTINFYILHVKTWPDLTTHFWSLAVEEQFYLLWPFVILFINKKYIVHAIIAFLLIGVVTECLIQSPEFGFVATYTCFDAFGAGALLAWILIYKEQLLKPFYRVLCVLSPFCILFLLIQIPYGTFLQVPQRLVQSVVALWIITFIVLNQHKKHLAFGFILNNRVLIFLGKISYGIYLYHIPIQWFSFIWYPLLKNPVLAQFRVYSLFVLNFCLLVLVSWLSWILIERPILGLKKRFEYQQPLQPSISS